MRMAASAHPVYLLNSSRVHVVPLCVGGGGRGGAGRGRRRGRRRPLQGTRERPRGPSESRKAKSPEPPEGTVRVAVATWKKKLNLTEWWWLLATCQNLFPLGDYDRVN